MKPWTIRQAALLGAVFGAAFTLPNFLRDPLTVNLGELIGSMTIGALLVAIAHRVLRGQALTEPPPDTRIVGQMGERDGGPARPRLIPYGFLPLSARLRD